MWEEGTLRINEKSLKYWVKHYEQPSTDYGIDGGRISKMEIRLDGEAVLLNYDRGWDMEPETEEAQLAYAYLLKRYN